MPREAVTEASGGALLSILCPNLAPQVRVEIADLIDWLID